jgi:hypothetical protein
VSFPPLIKYGVNSSGNPNIGLKRKKNNRFLLPTFAGTSLPLRKQGQEIQKKKEVVHMKKFFSLLGMAALSLFFFSSLSYAQHSHGGMSMGTSMKMDTREVLVEGVKVVFQIMANDEHKKMLKDMKMKEDVEAGTTHNITVTLKDEKTQKEITDAQINMKVVDPKGKDQIKALKYEDMMKSYDTYFNLPEKGKYQVITLFKIGDKKRTAGIYYELK